MKKILSVAAILGLAVFLWFYVSKTSHTDSSTPTASSVGTQDVGEKDAATYNVHFAIRQRNNQQSAAVLELKGQLVQVAQSPTDYASHWNRFDTLTASGKDVEAAIKDIWLNKTSLSVYEGAQGFGHYLPEGTPLQIAPIQHNILQKFFVPFLEQDLKSGVYNRTERDDIGSYQVQYTIEAQDKAFSVTRKWIGYSQGTPKVDAVDNAIVYTLTEKGRLIGAIGKITVHYHQSDAHFTTEFSVALNSSQPQAGTSKIVKKEELQHVSTESLARDVAKQEAASQMSYAEALEKFETITEATDSTEVYKIFSAFKSGIKVEAGRAQEIVDRIRKTTARDEPGKRKLAVLFGALAQSEDPAISESLANLAKECPDNWCKVQAIVGVNDHPNPTEDAAEKMLDMSRNATDTEIKSTAILAVGSVGRKLDASYPDLPKDLINDLNNPANAEIKSTVLAAMGNHGDGEYLPTLETYAKGKDSNLQAAAIYSMRYLPQESVNQTLLDVLGTKGSHKQVLSEVYKAMEYRNLSEQQYQDVARISAGIEDKDLQQNAARVLLQAYRDNPAQGEAAVRTFSDSTQNPDIKAFINEEIKAFQASQQPSNPQ